jgi:hypothetical protein
MGLGPEHSLLVSGISLLLAVFQRCCVAFGFQANSPQLLPHGAERLAMAKTTKTRSGTERYRRVD